MFFKHEHHKLCDFLVLSIRAVKKMEETLKETDLNETMSLSAGRVVAFLHKPKGPFKGLSIYASDREVKSDRAVPNNKVHIQFPKELGAESNNTIVFCMVSLPQMNETILGSEVLLYENRLIGLTVRGKTVSSLKEHVNITMNLTTSINSTLLPKCVFLNFSTNNFSEDGCVTQWTHDQVICSCNHFTYFGILMVSPNITDEDQRNLSYITLIGCGVSLIALFITLLLFITKRTIRADVSMKVHVNLAIALILLNVHLLPSQAVAAFPSNGLCFYMALLLHYSLLATFIWMALEGFHLYLLLVRVFNIYIRKYLLKLTLVGWGVPAVIVSIVVAIDRNVYGRTPENPQISNSTEICYIKDYTVKMVTTVGLFCLVFIFNFIMLIVTVRRILSIRHSKEYGQNESSRAKRDVCTLMGISILLGTTWGLIFFSFNGLPVAGLYAFCILNSLQGFFIFLWFVMSVRKTGNSTTKTSSETHSSHG
uniref:Adhesion G protein-coupled receptor G1 n=1 Tax=Sphaeramia orbicularis TaxID=375764 RepID=A0A672YKI2_9TELE